MVAKSVSQTIGQLNHRRLILAAQIQFLETASLDALKAELINTQQAIEHYLPQEELIRVSPPTLTIVPEPTPTAGSLAEVLPVTTTSEVSTAQAEAESSLLPYEDDPAPEKITFGSRLKRFFTPWRS